MDRWLMVAGSIIVFGIVVVLVGVTNDLDTRVTQSTWCHEHGYQMNTYRSFNFCVDKDSRMIYPGK